MLEKYPLLIKEFGVNGNRVTIKGTRIEPDHIKDYGTIEEIIEDFDLTREQVKQALDFLNS